MDAQAKEDDRRTQGAELGQRIAPKVRAWMANTEQLTNDVRTSAGTPFGKVRIGSLPSTAHPLVSTLYKRLKDPTRRTTRTIPIVMAVVGDPVATGLVDSLARPGGNVTGFSILAPELGTKRLELLKEIVPKPVVDSSVIESQEPAIENRNEGDADSSRDNGTATSFGRNIN